MNNRIDPANLQAILLDLDDTLLGNNMDIFLKAYLKLLAAHTADYYDPKLLVKHLMAATDVMVSNTNRSVSNEDAFWQEFSVLTGFDRKKMIPFFHRFYQTRFNEIQPLTQFKPQARQLIEWAFEQELQVVIATNPLFPMIAVEQRLAWAGIGIDTFEYTLVTCYENMHSAKPHAEYYREILEKLACKPSRALMVGDDWERDIIPASKVGINTYWIAQSDSAIPDNHVPLNGQGSLNDLFAWLQGN
ncbi:MAG: HAD family hydrolase [Anaerolineales bacterium]|nr:HAD family hydrolase [Anaerolineales bacterium]